MTRHFALLLMIATRAWACSCGGDWPSVKQMWEKTPFVFLGTVELADPDEDSSQMTFKTQSVHIRVDEAFKGVSKGQTIELYQGGTDCDAKFRTGQRAVFYLYRVGTQGSWSVPWCIHALGSAESGGDDLLFLRGLPKSAIGTRLSGRVYEDSIALRRDVGLPNVKIQIVGPREFTQELITNAAGVYEALGLEPGRYSVNIEVPKGLKIWFPSVSGSARVQGDDAAVELNPNGGASVDFVLQPDTELSGHMLDANGSPMTGVCIDLKPATDSSENEGRFFGCSKQDGLFKITNMPRGKYFLVAQDEVQLDLVKSKSTLYYPGVRDRNLAIMVSIEEGGYIGDLDIRLPSDERRYKISGIMQFADGTPVRGASVAFTSPDHGYSETTSTGPSGLFTLPVIAGMKGQLSGRLTVFEPYLASCPEFKVEPRSQGVMHFMNASPISVSSDSDHADLKLELSSSSCKFWPPGRK